MICLQRPMTWTLLAGLLLLAAALAYGQEPEPTAKVPPAKKTPPLVGIPYTEAQLRKAMLGQRQQMPNTGYSKGLLPPDAAATVFEKAEDEDSVARKDWNSQTAHWSASGLWHYPLYFEDVMLERHGHARGPFVQPWISGGRFFGTLPALAYKWKLDPPRTRFHTLGHYRPGSSAPLLWQRPRWRWDAAAAEAMTATGLIFVVP